MRNPFLASGLVFFSLCAILVFGKNPKTEVEIQTPPQTLRAPLDIPDTPPMFACGTYSKKLGSPKYYVQFGALERITSTPVVREGRPPMVGERVKVEWHPDPMKIFVSIDFKLCPPQ